MPRPIRLSRSSRQYLALRLLLLAVVIGVCACGRRAGETARSVANSLKPIPPLPGWRLDASEPQTNGAGLTLKMHWEGDLPAAGTPASAFLCLPQGATVRATLLSATAAGRPLPIDARSTITAQTAKPGHLSANSATCEFAGMLRRWPIYRLTPNDDVFSLARLEPGVKAVAGAPSLQLTLALAWQAKETKPTKPYPDSASSRLWQSTAAALVLNSVDLARYESAAAVLPVPGMDKSTDPRQSAPGERPWARLRVTQAGLVHLSSELLLSAGFPASLKLADVRVFSHGAPVPLLQAPGPAAPPGWEPGIYFWGRPGDSTYDAGRAYWVTLAGDVPATRLALLPAAPQAAAARPLTRMQRSALIDRDNDLETRHGSFLAIEEMRWVDGELEPNGRYTVPVELPHFADANARLRAEADFFIDRDEGFSELHVDVGCAGQKLATLNFTSEHDARKVFEIPGSVFRDGRATLTLTLFDPAAAKPAAGATPNPALSEGGMFFDNLRIFYPAAPRLAGGSLALDAEALMTSHSTTNAANGTPSAQKQTNPASGVISLALDDVASTQPLGLLPLALTPQGEAAGVLPRVAGNRVIYDSTGGKRLELLSPNMAADAENLEPVSFGDIHSPPATPCDLLIITHHEFLDDVKPLASYHEQQGIHTQVVDVQDIYDQFSHGEVSPEAIRAYLASILQHWPSPPAAVLLVGDCDSDYKYLAKKGVRNWVPTYTYNNGGETWASDYWFVTASGADDLGDYMIGRISVASRADAQTVINKIIGYGSTPRPGAWRARFGYVADAAESDDFADSVEPLRRDQTPAALGAGKVYLDSLPLEDNWYLPKTLVEAKRMKVSHTATEKIFDLFKSGTAYMEYFGHGSPNIWSNDRIWFGGNSPNSDNLHLAGTGYMPLVANMTCNSGAIDYPLPPWNICITEDMMRVKDGGAIACYVPSGPGVTEMHLQMAQALRQAMFGTEARGLGQLVALAKLRYVLERRPIELAYMYLLLGDPFLDLQLTKRLETFDLDAAALRPGSQIKIDLPNVPLDAGRFICELVDKDGNTLTTTTAADFSSGRITSSIGIPKGAPQGDARVRVYGWNPQSADDFAAAARFQIATPAAKLDSAELKENKLEVTVENLAAMPAHATLEVFANDGMATRTLRQLDMALAPNQKWTEGVDLPAEAPGGPEVILVRLTLPETPADPSQARVQQQALLGRLPKNFMGIVPGLSSLEKTANAAADNLHLTIAADLATSHPQNNLYLTLIGAKGDAWSTQPLTLTRRPGSFFAQPLLLLDSTKLANSKARLVYRTNKRVTLSETALAAIPRRVRNVRLVPGSVRTRPEHPTEGMTVFIDCTVENNGDIPIEAPQLTLFKGHPLNGGIAIASQEGSAPPHVPALAPGRSAPVTLRWEPVNNVGQTTIYLQLTGNMGETATSDTAHIVPVKVTALSKPHLHMARSWTEATSAEKSINRLRMMCTVSNTGQSDAHNVMVSFYRSRTQTPENKVNEQEIERVPGNSSVTVTYTWHYEQGRDVSPGGILPEATMQVWLKGSSQRLTQEPTE